jgi:hypothetical protein
MHEEYGYNAGFEVLTAAVMKSTIFWDITPCSQRTTRRCIPEDSTLQHEHSLYTHNITQSQHSKHWAPPLFQWQSFCTFHNDI